MKIDRETMLDIYFKLKTKEKQAWSNRLGYNRVDGLRYYLQRTSVDIDEKVVTVLFESLDKDRIEELGLSELEYGKVLSQNLIDYILKATNIQELEYIKNSVAMACDSQISRQKVLKKADNK